MIFGITGGSICAGRNTVASYLVKKYKFKKIDIFKEFLRVHGQIAIPKTKCTKLADYIQNLKVSSSNKNKAISNKQEGIINFFNLFAPENRKALNKFINGILDECRADWKNNYVVYPLPIDGYL